MPYRVSSDIEIDEKNIQFRFIHASGPGGQNVNKVATAVQLKFDVRNANLPDHVRTQLYRLFGNQINQEGFLIIEAKRYRSQLKNKDDAVNRLIDLIQQAMHKPKKRIPSKPSKASIRSRLEKKKSHAQKKASRKKINRHSNID